jgi:hypothetical protein
VDIEQSEVEGADANLWGYRPGTALLFSLTIVEQMLGKEKRDEVAGPMIVADTL